MNQQTIPTSASPEVIIEDVMGDLQIKGWDRDEVVVNANQDDLSLQEEDDVVHLSCRGNCAVRLPVGATLRIERVRGEARVKLLEDELHIEQVDGGLILRGVAECHVSRVNGEFYARDIAGDLDVDQVMGNAEVRDVEGDCSLDEVMGNAQVRDVEGSLQVNAHGNAWVRLSTLGGDNYEVTGNGNVFCRLPEETDAKFQLQCGAQNIRLKLPEENLDIREGYYEYTRGDGDVGIEIQAGGNLSVNLDEDSAGEGDAGRDFADVSGAFGQQFTQQIEAQVEAMTRQINDQLAELTARVGKIGLSEEETQEILQRARESSERAASRAQERMRKAQEKLERKLETSRRRGEVKPSPMDRRSKRSWSWSFSTSPVPPTPPSAPPPVEEASDEERLIILRMLEQKKISLEEAESLLAALEGRD